LRLLRNFPCNPAIFAPFRSCYKPTLISNPSYHINSRRMLLTISQSLDESYATHKIVPDVIDKFETQGLLTIEYDNDTTVTLGNTLKVSKTQLKPAIQFTLNSPNQDGTVEPVDENDKFLLVMTDPDAPSNSDHKWSEYAHWIVSDLQFKSEQASEDSPASITHMLDYNNGVELMPYMGPGPPENTGKHRYVFLLYKQDPDAKFVAPSDRPNWGTGIPKSGVRDWIKKHGANSKLLSVNFFYAQNEKNDK